MRIFIKKWGNSAAIRILASIMATSNLQLGSPVDIRVEDGRIVIDPFPDVGCDLEDLLAGIASENVHPEVDFGPAVDNELL